MEQIIDILGEPEVLAQLAEEASELAQAALKLRRAITGKNTTPKTEAECRDALDEEIADVYVALDALDILCDGTHSLQQEQIFEWKKSRWLNRLANGNTEGGTHNAL